MENVKTKKITMNFHHLLGMYMSGFIIYDHVINPEHSSVEHIVSARESIFKIIDRSIFDRRILGTESADFDNIGTGHNNYALQAGYRHRYAAGDQDALKDLQSSNWSLEDGLGSDGVAEVVMGIKEMIDNYYNDPDLIDVWREINNLTNGDSERPVKVLSLMLLLEAIGTHLNVTKTAKLVMGEDGLQGAPYSDPRLSIYDPMYIGEENRSTVH